MPLERSDIEASLLAKGFQKTGGDHRFYELVVLGKKTGIGTKISTGSSYKTYSDDLLAKMATQLKLTKQQLVDLVRCPFSETDMQRNLVEKGILGSDEVPIDARPQHKDVDVSAAKVRCLGREFWIVRPTGFPDQTESATRHVNDGNGETVGAFTLTREAGGPWTPWAEGDMSEVAALWVEACAEAGREP
ncbi:MAG: hypothetical protein JNL21_34950 [Myxococcales bacterium]|nr:hypothetical protein [Myxococcales bacterium]